MQTRGEEPRMLPNLLLTFELRRFVSPRVPQRHPETRRDVDGPPEEDHDQRPADEGTGPQQERAIGARITAEVSFLRSF